MGAYLLKDSANYLVIMMGIIFDSEGAFVGVDDVCEPLMQLMHPNREHQSCCFVVVAYEVVVHCFGPRPSHSLLEASNCADALQR